MNLAGGRTLQPHQGAGEFRSSFSVRVCSVMSPFVSRAQQGLIQDWKADESLSR
jgi:hypothetical protein